MSKIIFRKIKQGIIRLIPFREYKRILNMCLKTVDPYLFSIAWLLVEQKGTGTSISQSFPGAIEIRWVMFNGDFIVACPCLGRVGTTLEASVVRPLSAVCGTHYVKCILLYLYKVTGIVQNSMSAIYLVFWCIKFSTFRFCYDFFYFFKRVAYGVKLSNVYPDNRQECSHQTLALSAT